MPSKVESLEKELQKLKNLQQKTSEEPDFELVDCSDTPASQVLSFLSTQKLGPAGVALYDRLYFSRTLTEHQQQLLEKVLKKMDREDWLEPILEEISSVEACYEEIHKECQGSALGMR
jgi:hypothetical protein